MTEAGSNTTTTESMNQPGSFIEPEETDTESTVDEKSRTPLALQPHVSAAQEPATKAARYIPRESHVAALHLLTKDMGLEQHGDDDEEEDALSHLESEDTVEFENHTTEPHQSSGSIAPADVVQPKGYKRDRMMSVNLLDMIQVAPFEAEVAGSLAALGLGVGEFDSDDSDEIDSDYVDSSDEEDEAWKGEVILSKAAAWD